jgi:DNA invertase Pin-like site-specific DNA recombinase
MVYGYLRVSTAEQETEKFKYAILDFANRQGWAGILFVEEQVSGRKSYKARRLGELVERLKSGDVLIVPELSRLSRSIREIWEILETLQKKGVRVCVLKQGLDLQGKQDVQEKILLSVLAMLAEVERDIISQRTKEAMQAKKVQGVKLGRPAGKSKLDGKEEEIKQLLEKRVAVSAIARLFDVNRLTVQKFIKTKKLKKGVENVQGVRGL